MYVLFNRFISITGIIYFRIRRKDNEFQEINSFQRKLSIQDKKVTKTIKHYFLCPPIILNRNQPNNILEH
jgi:hypothetical protein